MNAEIEYGAIIDFRTAVPVDIDPESHNDILWHAIERSDVAVFWKDRKGYFVGGNAMLYRTLGTTPEDYIGKDDFDIFDREDAEAYRAIDFEVMESGKPRIDFRETVVHSDGTIEQLRTSKIPVRDRDGEIIGLMGCFNVITSEVEKEQALRTLEGRYALVREASRDGMWEFDFETEQIEASPRLLEMLEFEPTETRFPPPSRSQTSGIRDRNRGRRDTNSSLRTAASSRSRLPGRCRTAQPDGSTYLASRSWATMGPSLI